MERLENKIERFNNENTWFNQEGKSLKTGGLKKQGEI